MKRKLFGGRAASGNMTEGPIIWNILTFAVPIFLGQMLQQFYNLTDAWVVGNFADNASFAAVSSAGHITFLIVGFFNGIAVGGSVVISRYFGAGEEENIRLSVHNSFLFGLAASVLSTVLGLMLVPHLLVWMKTPESVLPQSMVYFNVYFAGVSTVILYNVCMAIMRAVGDSLHPLYYLLISSVLNIALDLLFVAGLQWGVFGAALATVLAQGTSVVMCMVRMSRRKDYSSIDWKKLRPDWKIMREVVGLGLPTGIQGAVISLGNLVVQANINSFGEFAISGVGAYSKVEGFLFLPINSMSMTLPTFIGQNLGARKYDRAKQGAAFGILCGMTLAELVGLLFAWKSEVLLGLFIHSPESLAFGCLHVRTTAPFFFLLAFSHCASGVMRGCGKSMVPMAAMLLFWCGVRIVYVTIALKIFPAFQTISWAYPLTWALSSLVFVYFLFRSDWTHAFEQKAKSGG